MGKELNLATTVSTLEHNARPYLQLAHCLCASRDPVNMNIQSRGHYLTA
jgi:hypothetical protein